MYTHLFKRYRANNVYTRMYCTIAKMQIGSVDPQILVLTNVLSGPRNSDSKNEVKNYQGALVTTSDFDLNLFRCLNPELPPMRECTSIIF